MAWLLVVCAAACTAGSAGPRRPGAVLGAHAEAVPTPRTLYDRLGGKTAITAVVDAFVGRVARDERINARFINADIPRLKRMLVDLICSATGGPCRYEGQDMRRAHAGMRITDAEFGALVENVKAALDGLKVPAAEQNELLGALAGMKPDIVTGRTPAPVAANAPGSARARVAPAVAALRESARLLEKAAAAHDAGNRTFADQLYSAAEPTLGPGAIAGLAPLFREGAPPPVRTPLKDWSGGDRPQPSVVGSSDTEQPERRPQRGSLVGTVVAGRGASPELSVVTLEPLTGKSRRRPPQQRIVEQRGREFAPKLLVVPVGSTVSFPNFDNIFHNVYSRSEPARFDLGLYRGGQAREVVFEREGLVRIGCNLHANMSATVVVVSAPHYGVTGAGGKFSFRSLTPGRYRLRVWGERREAPTVQDVTIKPAQNTVTVTLGGEAPAGPPRDKFGVPLVGTNGS